MPIEMPKGLPFSVDTWSPCSKGKRHHFLTHAHKDHSAGISTHFSYPIYSARLTKSLLLNQLPHLDSSLFVGIEVGETVVIDDPDGTFSVTAFDANHCPGALMFLFEGNFGNLLHTGDCRLTSECLQNLPEKYIGKKGREPKCRLDYLFLDCTFGKSWIKMPSKYSAIRQVINCIWKHPDSPTVYLTCDLLGHEEILVEISRTFGSKIYVDKTKNAECFQTLTLIAPDIMSEDESSRFQVYEGFPNFYERAKLKLTEARATCQLEPLFIRPSAQWYACEIEPDTESQRKQVSQRGRKDSFGVWHVCFSMHSSREELEWALQLLQPKRVISTTPSCRAMELSYVKDHSLSSQLTSDDPLWKLLDINMEVESISPQISPLKVVAATGLSVSSKAQAPQLIFSEVSDLKSKNLTTSTTNLSLNLSPPSTRSPITLFGRARLAVQDSNVLQDKVKTLPVETDLPIKTDSSLSYDPNRSIKEKSVLQEDITAEVQYKQLKEKEIELAKSSSHSLIGSSKGFNESLRKQYWSMNVPAPRPLPSLMRLMEETKRAKRKFQF